MRGFTWSAIGIEAVAQERIRTAEELAVHQHQIAAAISLLDAERLCPLLPARTERRDYSGREPANLGLRETPIRGAHVVPGWRARPRNPSWH